MKSKSAVRTTIVSTLLKIEREGSFANVELQALAQQDELNAGELRAVQKVVRGVLENRSRLDDRLNELVKKGGASLPPPVRMLLLAGLYQIEYLDAVKPAKVVNESVAFVKKKRMQGLSGLVNAVLRRAGRERAELSEQQGTSGAEVSPESLTSSEAVARAYSHPEWLVARWEAAFSLEEAADICRANNETWKLFARVNTLRCSLEEFIKRAQEEGVTAIPCAFANNCVVLEQLP